MFWIIGYHTSKRVILNLSIDFDAGKMISSFTSANWNLSTKICMVGSFMSTRIGRRGIGSHDVRTAHNRQQLCTVRDWQD